MQNVVEKHGTVTVMRLEGRLDAVTAPEFDRDCGSWIAQGEIRLVADLGELSYISSAGLRSVLSLFKALKAAGGILVLCRLQPMVQEVFAVSGLAFLLPICATCEEAIEQAAGPLSAAVKP